MPILLTADQAEPGDVVLAPDGQVYQYSGDHVWMHMDLIGFFGEPWKPEGELRLLLREGTPQPQGR